MIRRKALALFAASLCGAAFTACSSSPRALCAVSGSISGLKGSGLVLALDAADGHRELLPVSSSSFGFAYQLDPGSGYTVSVATQPSSPAQTCSVSNGSGTLNSANISDVAVSCATNSYSVGGTISGLSGSGLVLALTDSTDGTGSSTLTVTAGDTSFLFGTALTDGHSYTVAVTTQPSSPSQSCTISTGASGTLSGADVSDVAVSCATNSYSVGGTISGLSGSGLVLTLTDSTDGSGSSTLNLPAGTSAFSFATKVTDGHSYTVAITAQPSSPSQTCSVSSGASGTLSSANISNVVISCTTNSYSVGGTISGLSGSGLVLALTDSTDGTGSSTLGLDAGTSNFTFSTNITSGHTYDVAVTTQPSSPPQTCSVSSGASGSISSADVTDVSISCVTNTYSISGTITNLTGVDLSVTLALASDAGSSSSIVSATADAGTSYSFASVTSDTYTLTPSVTGALYTLSPSNAAIDLTSDATQDFTLACAANYIACSTGCCPKAVAISAYSLHTCVILYGGSVKCWGLNISGQIGDNSSGTNRLVPTATTDSSTSYSAIATGAFHSCGVTSTGTVTCWGDNDFGQIGDNSSGTNRLVPTASADSFTTYSAIAAGAYHSCGITSTGTVTCWGYNNLGQIGDNSSGTNRLIPTTSADSSTSYSAIAAGIWHACGITSTGIIKCWGDNDFGQIGDNSSGTNRLVPTTSADSSTTYSAIATGAYHSCGITSAGAVKCWGGNDYGQLGNNSTVSSLVPVNVQF